MKNTQVRKLFGTDGIRGRANEYPMTVEMLSDLGAALASIMPSGENGEKTVLIGQDTRLSGDMLHSAIVASLLAHGVSVDSVGVLPTPAVAYLTSELNYTAGIMLTASHNPFEDNGIKIFNPNGYKLDDEQELQIEDFIFSKKEHAPSTGIGVLNTAHDLGKRYVTHAKNLAESSSLSGLKIVLDCAHGAAYAVAPVIFEELGAEVVVLNNQPNGKNINTDCGAIHPQHTAAAVLEHQADIGVCFDGDADRVIFIDELGAVIDGDLIISLCAVALKKQGQLQGDTVVATVMSNLAMIDYLAEHGIKMMATPVGDRHVVEKLREKGFALGGENSGHIIFTDAATTGDGIVSALKVISFMQREEKTLSELSRAFTLYPNVLEGINVSSKPAIDSVPELKEVIEVSEKELAESGRVLVRYSGTENKIRVFVEAKEKENAQHYADKICDVVHQTLTH